MVSPHASPFLAMEERLRVRFHATNNEFIFLRKDLRNMTLRRLWVGLLLLLAIHISPIQAVTNPDPVSSPVVNEVSLEQKRVIRKQLLSQMVEKYNQNQVFPHIQAYMVEKYHQMKKKTKPKPPAQLIVDTLERSRSVYEKTRSFVGESFKRVYNPLQIESTINRYLWLKGLCFLVLGINEEHKIALSYFYQPGNEQEKLEFLHDAIHYSFPEIPDVPANSAWYEGMTPVMDRLCFKLFNIDKYSPGSAPSSTPTAP
ncbi:hypothetical protein EDC14_104923 [Hydrogenispora ethanolica]|uniref:Uncharacterized protein n=1 Tax=Hydrogenispora ethanolica TaxID=1082276 RepID=A0A4R1QRK2_HYDET|nr:hypothetical protein [Hydrogenispora ethanolica]TCL56499.1 hypothetical protein EDC14_104923 [Hydrogenispora ethanolica]